MQASQDQHRLSEAQLAASSQAAEVARQEHSSLKEAHAQTQAKLAQHEAAAAAAAQDLDVLKVCRIFCLPYMTCVQSIQR